MAPDDLIGATLGSYRVTGKLGQGGMGAVYLAEHPALGRKAAVKVLLPELSAHGEAIERFFHEARTTAKLRHPAMVDVFDYGTLPDGRAYLVMDFLEGESLQARLERVGALPAPQALDLVREIALGMSVAHEEKIVHRDLKPDNVFILPPVPGAKSERVKILDFGIAKLTRNEGGKVAVTRTGALLGTPLYMSPEQCRGTGEVDHRSDIYSLGCILFTMLAARPPFNSEGMGELLGMHLFEPPPTLASVGVRVSAEIEALVARMLAKGAADRFESMLAVAEEIGRILAAGTTGARATSAVAAGGTAMLSPGTVTPSRGAAGTRMLDAPPAGTLGAAGQVGRSTLSDAAGEARARSAPSGSGFKVAVAVGALVLLVGAGIAAFVLGRPDAPAAEKVPPEERAAPPRPAVAPVVPTPVPDPAPAAAAPSVAPEPAAAQGDAPSVAPTERPGKKPRPGALSNRRGSTREERQPPTEQDEKRSERTGRPVYKGTKLRIETETPY